MKREEIIQAIGLSSDDLDSLCLLDRAITSEQQDELIAEEKNQAIAFLEKSIGNMELNKQLLELGKLEQQDTGISFNVNRIVRHLTFKSRHWQKLRFSQYEHITLAKRGILFDLASLVSDLAIFERMGLLIDTSSLSQIYMDAKKASEEGFSKELTASSDMVFEIKAMKGAPMVPRMNYRKDEFVLTEFLYSEVYKIKLDKLIEDDETKRYLKKHLGDNWLQQLERKFSAIQREIHDAELIGPIHHVSIQQGSSAEKHFHSEEKNPATLICSPFVGMCTVKVIKKLNAQITQELKNKGVQEIPPLLLQLPINEKLKALSPADFLDALDKCNALERLPGTT
ncbi:hypothetical protein Lgra_1250 [Legionella gratiana]|uniref:Uncharacterized protein n=1 Tax=Legionella gratiana TaxID=45066 RepID=A0A378J032_9GAMM|nr:hypothetical protein [Legionella gratiana]KTD11792.1 hypothetical protein Lgra_1250 [Legionella gratiana]STX40746.1 Uncharacterised protein [Legionella gratiana]